MAPRNPIDALDTHQVTNQPPPFENMDLFAGDRALVEAVMRAGGGAHGVRLSDFGRMAGSAEAIGWARDANRNPPVLENYDRYGRRIDEVRFHPAYHRLMCLGLDNGIAAAPWNGTPAGHVLHAAQSFMLGQTDAGVLCPMTMSYAAVPALRTEPAVGEQWAMRVIASRYDPASLPAEEKAGVTIGMAMTEKQGGSDVRANSTRAEAIDSTREIFRLTGHKWFCSVPMSDAFLTLAYTGEGLSCFLLPRWLPGGERNAGFRIVQLKDKMGDRSNASSEVEYHGALAHRIGEEGRGIPSIMAMVQHTRLDCVIGSASTMRAALAQALWHAAHRSAFQKRLIDQPLMIQVLADLAVESEAATALAFRLAAAFDADEPLIRILTPIAKYWVCKRTPGFVYEAMECLGGAGYVETGEMPRLFRQSPLNAIWEGSGNVIALDVGRALARETEGREALMALLGAARGNNADYDRLLAALPADPGEESGLRHHVGQLALLAQAAILIMAGSPVADVFCDFRLTEPAAVYGASAAKMDGRAIVSRAMPG